MSSPSSPVQHESPVEEFSSPSSKRTRTVAIVKNHALDHRFDIEMRMTEAGFEIVKERQMEFDVDTDPDTMFDIFGQDYVCFAEGPVRVYILERRRAVQVWHTLMGPEDPEVAREEAPNSIRALYGLSKEQNAVMGAPDAETAEFQVQSIFASSPPFPTTDLPSDPYSDGLYSNGTQSFVENMAANGTVRSRSSGSTHSTARRGSSDEQSKFKARPLPTTHTSPDIVPRMSRAAALRTGMLDPAAQPKRHPATAESVARTFAGVPGHKRSSTITVASTAPPVVAPRMTRAASLRLGQPVPSSPVRPKAIEKSKSAGAAPSAAATFDGVPGHKRRDSIAVASTKPPTVAPRSNRSAELRVKKEAAPPSSFNFGHASTISRSSSRTSINQPTNTSRPPTRPASSASVHASSSARPPISRSTSRLSTGGVPSSKPLSLSSELNKLNGTTNGDATNGTTPAKAKRLSVGVPPTIMPRTNKSAALRAAKMSLGGGPLPTNGAKTPMKKTTTTSAVRA